MAHDLGLEVNAECVETETQAALLRELGCNEAQGHLFSPPLDSKAAISFITAHREAPVQAAGDD